MKTNEEKLLKLLQIAKDNGWDVDKLPHLAKCAIMFNPTLESNFIVSKCFTGTYFSLNDLVTNFKEGEVSFIKALCNYSVKNFGGFLEQQEIVWFKNLELWEQVVISWSTKKEFSRFEKDFVYSIRPTSQRLDWLFKTFNHLL